MIIKKRKCNKKVPIHIFKCSRKKDWKYKKCIVLVEKICLINQEIYSNLVYIVSIYKMIRVVKGRVVVMRAVVECFRVMSRARIVELVRGVWVRRGQNKYRIKSKIKASLAENMLKFCKFLPGWIQFPNFLIISMAWLDQVEKLAF